MKTSMTVATFVVLSFASVAAAGSPPSLPSSAKKLTGKEITALYDGSTVNFNNFTMAQSLMGTATYDLKGHLHHGTYSMGGKSGTFSGITQVKGNQFCHREGNSSEHCSSFTPTVQTSMRPTQKVSWSR
jgi:hypothetical protein